ncbi:PREDICTED: coiled-coil domain-containing protein 115-like [Branchiostoma belcheri]|uniref:Vacuolar ATPase assembly protein VMA22 n=1 Tax=Branchiostoma belcheri TaxID=7741 RepID=A0A6P4Z8C5_BRABE|nr:PREDICTED: coiled-coil domain-containing protein 115-like [Branchiostoma belcheri]
MELNTVCERLDELVVELFDKLEALTAARKRMDDHMKQGFFNLAKARYSLGVKGVGQIQYAAIMEPLVHVHVSDEDGSNKFNLDRIIPSKSSSGAVKKVSFLDQESKVRRRHTGKRDEENDEQKEGYEEGGEDDDEIAELSSGIEDLEMDQVVDPHSLQDPLRWFGILVPPCLRHGQHSFNQVIAVSCQVASLQSQVDQLRLEYRQLLREKQQLLQQSA